MSTPSSFSSTPQPKKSGSKVLIIILVVLGLLALLCAGICGGCMLTLRNAGTEIGSVIELSGVMSKAVIVSQADQQVLDKLGDPIQQMGPPIREGSGEVNPVHESFHFELTGPKGTGHATGHATKVNGAWQLTEIVVEFGDGDKITITPPADAAPELNFDTK